MRKKTLIFLALCIWILALSGCGCKHEWIAATCQQPATCALCGQVQGEALSHEMSDWAALDQQMVRSCQLCGTEETAEIDYELLLWQMLPGYWYCEDFYDSYDEEYTETNWLWGIDFNDFAGKGIVPHLEFTEDGEVYYFDSHEKYEATMDVTGCMSGTEGYGYVFELTVPDTGHRFVFTLYQLNNGEIWIEFNMKDTSFLRFFRESPEQTLFREALTAGTWVFYDISVMDDREPGDCTGYYLEFEDDRQFSGNIGVELTGSWYYTDHYSSLEESFYRAHVFRFLTARGVNWKSYSAILRDQILQFSDNEGVSYYFIRLDGTWENQYPDMTTVRFFTYGEDGTVTIETADGSHTGTLGPCREDWVLAHEEAYVQRGGAHISQVDFPDRDPIWIIHGSGMTYVWEASSEQHCSSLFEQVS